MASVMDGIQSPVAALQAGRRRQTRRSETPNPRPRLREVANPAVEQQRRQPIPAPIPAPSMGSSAPQITDRLRGIAMQAAARPPTPSLVDLFTQKAERKREVFSSRDGSLRIGIEYEEPRQRNPFESGRF